MLHESCIVVYCQNSQTAGDSTAIVKRKTLAKDPNTTRILKFVREAQKIIDKNPIKSINTIVNQFKVSKDSIGRIVHVDLRCTSYVMRRG